MLSAPTPSTFSRKAMAIPPQSSSAAITGTGIDCQGFAWMDCTLLLGTMATNATSDVIFEEGDTLGGAYTAITGAVFAQKVAATHASKAYSGQIDLRKRKRFIRCVATQATAASLVAVVCTLTGADRTERVQAAQLGSSPAATPLATDAAAGGAEFTV